MQRPVPEATFHIVLIGLVGYFLMESYSIRGSAVGGGLSPAFFPKAICIALIAMLVLSLVTTLVKSSSRQQASAPRQEATVTMGQGSLWVSVIAWVAVLSLLVLYAVLLETLGYVVTTSLLIFCMVSILVLLNKQEQGISAKGVVSLIAFSVFTSLVIFMLFSKGFSIILPTLGIAGV